MCNPAFEVHDLRAAVDRAMSGSGLIRPLCGSRSWGSRRIRRAGPLPVPAYAGSDTLTENPSDWGIRGGSDELVTIADEPRTTVRTRLSAPWAALMLLYVYADVLSLFRPGQLDEMAEGRTGPVEATQATLLLAATIVVVPAPWAT